MFIEGLDSIRQRFGLRRFRNRAVRVVRKGGASFRPSYRSSRAARLDRIRKAKRQRAERQAARYYQRRGRAPDGPVVNATYSQSTPEMAARERAMNARLDRYNQLRAAGYDYVTTIRIMRSEFGF